jgi:hypothetical protein
VHQRHDSGADAGTVADAIDDAEADTAADAKADACADAEADARPNASADAATDAWPNAAADATPADARACAVSRGHCVHDGGRLQRAFRRVARQWTVPIHGLRLRRRQVRGAADYADCIPLYG